MIFETHAHYDDKAFDEERAAVLEGLPEKGIGYLINPGCDTASSQKAAALAETYGYIWFAAGIHPEELPEDMEGDLTVIEQLAGHKKCVAIGEIGLDYYWDAEHKDIQKALFERQLEIALRLDKPVIIHDREAHADTMSIIRRYPKLRGVFHCFSGSAEMAAELLKMGWYLGFDGPITYKNARKAIEVLEVCPMDRMLVETDSPYLSPVPHRGKRNDSGNLVFILDKIAEVKGLNRETVEAFTENNACELFNVPKHV